METQEKSLAVLGIPVTEVQTMVSTFYSYSSQHPKFDVNTHVKCVWFPILQITTMVDKLKQEGADGLRVYLGRYPTDVSDFEDPKPTPDTNSIIFVSTRNEDGQAKTDYFIDMQILPENRGEQCQPHCNGVKVTTP